MNKIRFISLLGIFPLILTACGSKAPESIAFTLPDNINGEFHSEKQLGYFADPSYNNIDTYTGARVVDESKSLPINISFTADVVGGKLPAKMKINISETNDFNKYQTFYTTGTTFELKNLKLNTTYFYKLVASYSDKSIESDVASFKTSDKGIRNLTLENVVNVRDLGGYGLKQGLIYRSAEFNTAYTKKALPSKDDLNTFNNVLGIKSDIDFRLTEKSDDGIENGGITSSPLGKNVKYYSLPMVFKGTNVLTNDLNQDSVKKFFSVLADESNYPVVFHCAQGKDRTGCMAYIIEALCGASNDMMMRDYLFTNFSNVNGVCKENDIIGTVKVGGTIAKKPGDTLQEKAYYHLVNDIGIEKATLDKIVSILSE